MAIIQPTDKATHAGVTVTWTGITQADSGAAYDFSRFTDLSVQIRGTFGSGGTMVVYGTNIDADAAKEPSDATASYRPLQNVDGLSDISATSALIAQILEATKYVAPEVTAGTGVSLDVIVQAFRRAK
ncbi:MAG: hypothetical protein ABFD79_14760 [Phycisphaerales bacterium]